MLRIQSLAIITFEIDENFTPVLQNQTRKPDPKTSVTSLDKRDRQSLFQWTGLNPSATPPTTFLFLLSSIVKKPTVKPSKPQKHKNPPNLSPAKFSTASSETFRASSAAARSATALVDERRYKPTHTNTSTGPVRKKSEKFHFPIYRILSKDWRCIS